MVNIKRGDYGYDLSFTITDGDNNRLNLSGATINFKMEKADIGSPVICGTCDINTAVSGTCHYTVPSGTMITSGTYKWELETAYSTQTVTTERTENIVIQDDINC